MKRPIAGFASQAYGLDESGRPKFWTLRKGNVDDALSWPTLIPSLLKTGIEISPISHLPFIGAPLRKQREWLEAHGDSLVPEISRDAVRRQRTLKRAIRQDMQLSAPENVADRTLEGIGTMAGQMPIPATKAKAASSVMRRILGAVPEYLGPTIKPRAGNYLSGSLAGGILGGGDDEPDQGEYAPVLTQIAEQYPRIGSHLDSFAVERGPNLSDGRQLEYYPPDEAWNPHPGKSTIEIYKPDVEPDELRNLIAGETLHLLGGRNEKGVPNDAKFAALKDALIESRTPDQRSTDARVWKERYADQMPYEDFIKRSRADEYAMGYLFPDAADEWRKQNTYTDEQKKLLEQMRAHLQTAEEPAQKAHGGYMQGSRGMRPRGALRFGYGGMAQLAAGQQQGPFGLTSIEMANRFSGAPTTSTNQIIGTQPINGASKPTPMSAPVMNRARARPMSMDDYLNYGMRAAKKFYVADGGPVTRADLAINSATEALRKLSARVGQSRPVKRPVRRADGGKAGITASLLNTIQEALEHARNRDIGQALRTLGASKEALAHPEVAKARDQMRYVEGRRKGTDALNALVAKQGPPLGLADGGEAEGALPDASEDPQMLFVEMQQLIAAVQSGRLSHEEEEQASERIDAIEQLLTSMGVPLPGFGDPGGGLPPDPGGGMTAGLGVNAEM
jgi:hypothetical protein